MTVDINIFKPPETDEESGRNLASHMPQGRAWDKKNIADTNLNGLVRGLSANAMSVQQKIYEMAQEFDINQTSDLLEDWEESVGIPDDCVFVYSDIEDRRNRVIQRLRNVPVVTMAEIQAYIDAFFVGYTVTLQNASAATEFEYEFEFDFVGDMNNRFVIIADISDGGDIGRLRCLLRDVLPANVVIYIEPPIFSFAEDPEGVGFGTEDDSDIGGHFANI